MNVIARRCPQNHPCPLVRMCPVGAISQSGFRAPVIDDKKCIECGLCTVSCAYGAVTDGASRDHLPALS